MPHATKNVVIQENTWKFGLQNKEYRYTSKIFKKKYILLGSDMLVSNHDHKPLGTLRATFSAIRSGFLNEHI
jgi:hypothetical protein